MRKLILVAGAVLALSGCSQMSTATSTVQQLCAAATPMLNAAAVSTNTTVSSTAVYGTAFCSVVNAGGTPSTADANSPAWLESVISGVQVAAQVGGIVLPLVTGL